MSRNGTSKRKRTSESDGDIENLPVSDAKRLREEETTEVRLPLAELNDRARRSAYDSDNDSEWFEARAEESLEESDECVHSSETDSTLSQNDPESPPPSPESTALLFFDFRKHFGCKLNLKNFFERKNCSSSDDRTDLLFERNPQLQPRMRSVLLEWIIEVCDVYKLHRETYHLTVDYLDRYLGKSSDINKSQLQLIGVTALFLASKYEEIYPPKVVDFAYITDGACTVTDILKMESLMIRVLGWKCTVISSNAWVLGFLQLLSLQDLESEADINIPLYSPSLHSKIVHLLDLCSLDSGFVKYPYKILALSSIHAVVNDPTPIALEATEYTREDLLECLEWMLPFWTVLRSKFDYENADVADLKTSSPVKSQNFDVTHLRAKHNVDLDLLEAVHKLADRKHPHIPELLLTPPLSSEKSSKTC